MLYNVFFFSDTNLSWYCETIGYILKYILGNIPRFLWERYSKTTGKYSRSNFTGRRISLTILITFYTIIWSLESVAKHKFEVIIFNLTTLWTRTFNKQNAIQTSHPDYTQEHETFTGVITNTLNLSYSVTVTRPNKIPILTDDTYYNMTYSSIGRKAFHRALWMCVTTSNEWPNIQWLFFNVCVCFLS